MLKAQSHLMSVSIIKDLLGSLRDHDGNYAGDSVN